MLFLLGCMDWSILDLKDHDTGVPADTGELAEVVPAVEDTGGGSTADTADTGGSEDTAPPIDTGPEPVPCADELLSGRDDDGNGEVDDLYAAEAAAELYSSEGRHLGYRLEDLGDQDGDGLTDLGVSGIYAMNGSESRDSGRVFVVPGGTCGERDVDELPTLHGEHDEGASVALTSLGDVDGDGWDDLAVGAPTHTWHNTSVLPRVYVVHGPVQSDAQLADVAEATLVSESSTYGFGAALSTTDVTDDGTADLLVGARGYPDWSGSVLVYEGPVSGSLVTADATARLAGDGYAAVTCVVGDMDGDGRDEVGVGEYGHADGKGALTLVTGPLSGTVDLTSEALRVVGDQADDRLGAACQGLDWNGDGHADLVGMASGAGETRIWLSDGSLPSSLTLSADVHIGSTTSHGSSVYSTMRALDDLDGDGDAELIVGDGGYNGMQGRAVLLYGGLADGTYDLDTVSDTVLEGADADSRFGFSFALGHVDSDGVLDLFVSAPGENEGDKSRVYGFVTGF